MIALWLAGARILAAIPAVGLVDPADACTGTWFDIGANQAATVNCCTDGIGWELFPAYPFGPSYPPGTLVYAELEGAIPCGAWFPVDCARFVAGYRAYFNDGGCGCGGFLAKPIRLRLHYDDATVQALGGREQDLAVFHLNGLQWEPLQNVALDTQGNFIEGDMTGWILADHFYVILIPQPSPVEPTTWGRLKSQWR